MNHSWYQVLVLMCGADLQLTSTIWVDEALTTHRIAIVGSPSHAILGGNPQLRHRHIVLRRAAYSWGLFQQDGKVYNLTVGGDVYSIIFHHLPMFSVM